MVTLTRPAPDSPVTSALAISSWAFCICSCICCAFFIRSPMLFIICSSPACLDGADALFNHPPFKSFNNTFYHRVLTDRLLCRFLPGCPLPFFPGGRGVKPWLTLLYSQ